MTTTIAKPRKPAKLDRPRIVMEESAAVARALRAARKPERRLELASEIVAAAEREVAPLRPQRDAAALSLALYDGVRAVQDVIGVSRIYFYAMRFEALGLTEEERGAWLKTATREQVAERAQTVGVPHVEEAIDVASSTGEQIARAEERAAVARIIRDTAIVELWRAGWNRGPIAAIAHVAESRISQIVGAATPVAS